MKKIEVKLQKLQPLSEILQLYAHGLMPLDVAVSRSGLSKRTFQRRMQIWRQGGPATLEHGNSGRKAINRLSDTVRAQIIGLIQNKYWDHGPTLLSEQLLKYEDIKISRETARKLIKEAFNDKGFEPRSVTEHPLRRRRGALGELIQIDGSLINHASVNVRRALHNNSSSRMAICFLTDARAFAAAVFWDSSNSWVGAVSRRSARISVNENRAVKRASAARCDMMHKTSTPA